MDREERDEIERIQREQINKINADPGSREALEEKHGQVWDTTQLQQDFTVKGFMAPWVSVVRKSDNKSGSLEFQHSPRFYYNFQPTG